MDDGQADLVVFVNLIRGGISNVVSLGHTDAFSSHTSLRLAKFVYSSVAGVGAMAGVPACRLDPFSLPAQSYLFC